MKVLILRAMLSRADILLLDEVTKWFSRIVCCSVSLLLLSYTVLNSSPMCAAHVLTLNASYSKLSNPFTALTPTALHFIHSSYPLPLTSFSQPTNHLDHASVAWLTQYLNSQMEVTCLIVSHDTLFLDNVVTDIIHYETVRHSLSRLHSHIQVPCLARLSFLIGCQHNTQHYS